MTKLYLSLVTGNTFPFLSFSSSTKAGRWYKNFLHFFQKSLDEDFSLNPRDLLELRSFQNKLLWMFLLMISAAHKKIVPEKHSFCEVNICCELAQPTFVSLRSCCDLLQRRESEVISLCSIFKKNTGIISFKNSFYIL